MEEIRNEEIVMDATEETVTAKKVTVVDKVKGLVGQAKAKICEGVDYIKENPEEFADKAMGVVAIGGTIGLGLLGISATKKAERLSYSDEIGECVELKHKLTNRDKVEIDYRMQNGESKIQAMSNLGLIKEKK